MVTGPVVEGQRPGARHVRGAWDDGSENAPEMRKTEGGSVVAAVDRAQQRKQGVVLRYCQKLPVKKDPSPRTRIEGDDTNFCQKRFAYLILLQLLMSAGEFLPAAGSLSMR